MTPGGKCMFIAVPAHSPGCEGGYCEEGEEVKVSVRGEKSSASKMQRYSGHSAKGKGRMRDFSNNFF